MGEQSSSRGLREMITDLDGRPVEYRTGGSGPPVVFLHGWGLTHRTYRRTLDALAGAGVRIYAPALPGFGGTAELPEEQMSLAGYGQWVARFLEAVDVTDPVTLIGHSFGGGVAIQTAVDAPDHVRRLVLVNSIGGSAWSQDKGVVRALRERPLWDWGLHLQADILPVRQLTRVLPVIVADAVPSLVHNPRAVWRVANLARTADLTAQLQELKRRHLPVVILWGRNDTVLPHASLLSMRTALGEPTVITVPGNHSWLLADPRGFGEIMTNVLSDEVSGPELPTAA